MPNLNEIFAKVLNISVEKVCDNLSMDNTPEWDSLSHIELLFELQQLFSVEFDPYESISMIDYMKVKEVLKNKNVIC